MDRDNVSAKPGREEPLRRMLEAGASLSGATAGAAVGAAVAGPVGIPGGAAAGWAVEQLMQVGGEYAVRTLGRREEMRVGSVLLLASDEISARVMRGDEPREDLRELMTPSRSAAEELAEAALQAAAHTHEERKLPFLAHLIASITFDESVSHAHANQLLRLADDLTYRQLALLSAYAELGKSSDLLELWGEAPRFDEESGELASLRADLLDLFRRGLVRVSQRERSVRKEKPYRPSASRRGSFPRFPEHEYVKEQLPWPAMPGEISPRDVRLSLEGALLARLMRVEEIPSEEQEQLVLQHLRLPPRPK